MNHYNIIESGAILHQRYRVEQLLSPDTDRNVVYRATDLQQNARTVVIKQYLKSASANAEREISLIRQLDHSGIPRFLDTFSHDRLYFLVMEYISGKNLLDAAKSYQNSLKTILGWAAQLLDILTHLHSQTPPIIHRDIKPQNVLVTEDGRVVLLDFDIAKVAASNRRTLTNQSHTPLYAPIEQIEGRGTDERSDIFSYCATLYHVLIGTPPPLSSERMETQKRESVDPCSQIALRENYPFLPKPLHELLGRGLSIGREERPADTQQIVPLLQAAQVELAQQTTQPTLNSGDSPLALDKSTLLVGNSQRQGISRFAFNPLLMGTLGVLLLLMITAIIPTLLAQQNNPIAEASTTPTHSGLSTTPLSTPSEVPDLTTPPTITSIITNIETLEAWPSYFEDRFDDNRNDWNLNLESYGIFGSVDRALIDNTLILTGTSATTWTLFMHGDSRAYERSVYYMTIDVKKLAGTNPDDRCGVNFNELSENDHSNFQIREHGSAAKTFSVVTMLEGGKKSTAHLARLPVAMILPEKVNTLGIYANGEYFAFFINRQLVGDAIISRWSGTRVDASVIASIQGQPVVCQFDNFIVRAPPQ